MNVSYLIQVLEKKEIILSNAKAQAFSVGDLDGLNTVDKELLETQSTLSQLRLLADVTHAAAQNNTSAADLLASSLDSLQTPVQGPSAGAIINGYDISSYATDPLYEDKIRAILAALPTFEHIEDVDAYIQAIAVGSPVTAMMIKNAVEKYNVDVPLLIAIMQNDSQFGTEGVGARTNNPGNVGNTGYATQSYASWDDGVAAVAEWLSRHKVVVEDTPPTPEVVPVAVTPIVPKPEPVVPIVLPATTTPATSTPLFPEATSTPPIATSSPSVGEASTTPFTLSSTTPEIPTPEASSTATTTP